MSHPTDPTDPWTSKTYSQTVAPFVSLLTTRVTLLLNPQSTDKILDLGCGDGILTSLLASKVHTIHGLDSSPNLIASAISTLQQQKQEGQNITYELKDCRYLSARSTATTTTPTAKFTKVFSNAALHWILRDEATRSNTLAAVFELLQPGGAFVAEMGGLGNVAEVQAALIAALVHRGIPVAEARKASPWFFPSTALMRSLLEEAGFVVEVIENEFRQTLLTGEEGGGGLEGWVRLFGERFLRELPVGEEEAKGGREGAVREVCEVLESGGRRMEDGGFVLGYVRLRFVARKAER